MKNFIINLLFSLLGNSTGKIHNIQYLFGASTSGHTARKKRWEKALARMYKDKDMLDFLYYHAESDKETVFKGKLDTNLSRGARIRTLFIVHQAHRAYEEIIKRKRSNANEVESKNKIIKKLSDVYKSLVDIR